MAGYYKKFAKIFLLLLTLLGFLGMLFFVPRIPQWSGYHQFADTRNFFGIPNFLNIISNLPFLIVSIIGFLALHVQWKNKHVTGKECVVFLIIFVGIFLSGLGSSYYHLSPDNNSLLWDRIPITVVFMSILAFTLMERVSVNLGFRLLLPLLAFGIFSVLYWRWTEFLGQSDLRLYVFVQFYSMLLILIILWLFPKPYPPLKIFLWMFVFYGLAKLCEGFDQAIYQFGGVISGHTLKHLFAAMGAYCTVIILRAKKNLIPDGV